METLILIACPMLMAIDLYICYWLSERHAAKQARLKSGRMEEQ